MPSKIVSENGKSTKLLFTIFKITFKLSWISKNTWNEQVSQFPYESNGILYASFRWTVWKPRQKYSPKIQIDPKIWLLVFEITLKMYRISENFQDRKVSKFDKLANSISVA
jgi:hypothetical protein